MFKVIKTFFDFLFYGIYTEYAKEEKGAASSASAIVGGLWTMNLLFVIMLASTYSSWFNLLVSKVIVVGLLIIFQIISYFVYLYRKDHYIDQIRESWVNKTDPAKVWIRVLIVGYISISVLAFFGVAIYIGSQK